MALDEKLVNLADLKAAIDSIPKSDADMTKAVYDTNNNGIVDNAEKVNGHTVNTDVPSNAKFTDTVYDDTALAGRVSTIEGKESGWDAKQNAISDLAAIRSGAALGATALQSFTETDPTVPSWAKQAKKPTYTASEVGALPDTTVIPTVPTAEISANTAARHTHTNKAVIDGITAEDISKWNSGGGGDVSYTDIAPAEEIVSINADYLRGYSPDDFARPNQVSNRNLLDNPWFTINQRQGYILPQGKPFYNDADCTIQGGTAAEPYAVIKNGTNYALVGYPTFAKDSDVVSGYTGQTYTVDRWQSLYATDLVLVNGNGITVKNTDYCQKIELRRIPINKPLTASILFTNGILEHFTFEFDGTRAQHFDMLCANGVKVWVAYDIWSTTNNAQFFIHTNGQAIGIRAVKLEIGTVSTLALDYVPDYATELLKCQRYFYTTFANATYTPFGLGVGNVAAGDRIIVPFTLPTEMVKNPTLKVVGLSGIRCRRPSEDKTPTSISYDISQHYRLCLRLMGSFTAGEVYYCLSIAYGSYLEFIADL